MAEPNEPPHERYIRTMKTDSEELLKREKTSFLDLVARERRTQESSFPAPVRRAQSSNAFRIIGVVLGIFIFLGAAGGGFLYWKAQKDKKETPPPFAPPRSFIAGSQTELIKIRPGDRTGLLENIENKKKEFSSPDNYLYLPIVLSNFGEQPRIASPKDFFETLRIQVPPELFESFGNRWNVYVKGGHYIFVFETADRFKTRGAMLEWEPKMVENLSPLLGAFEPGLHQFDDGVIKNIDVRITRLSSQEDLTLGYSLVLGKYLILTTSESGLEETISRFIAQPPNG